MSRKVEILLSTYNGEKYLEEQLESLQTQSYKNIHLLVRDDGSKDETRNILKRYAKKHNNSDILIEKNKGVIPSFFELLQQSSEEAHYFAFCDQDDYWKPDKLETAVHYLEKVEEDIPAMYCSRVELVDRKLRHIGMYPLRKRGASFENAIVQNIATGCTIVMNKAAKRLILKYLPSYEKVIMHDWWFYLVVSAFGIVLYDSESHMLYRQHGANTVGADNTIIGRWITRFNRYMKQKQYGFITRQAEEFMRLYGNDLDGKKKEILKAFIDSRQSIKGRIRYFFTGQVHRQSWSESLVCRIVLLLNMV